MAGLIRLVQRQPVTGSRIFDLQIVATMLENNIHRINAFNAKNFNVFPELAVIIP